MPNSPIRQHQIYPDDFPPSWASDYGEDAYGLWLAFKYKGTEQRFRWCEPGTFMMGSPENEPGRYNNETQHEVTVSQGFWLGEVPVTQALWAVFMGDNRSLFKGGQRPVEQVSWDDAQHFIQTLNGLKSELGLRLPTEAEWEYACRAGTSGAFHFGNTEDLSLERVSYSGHWNDFNIYFEGETQDVRSLSPNLWGLYQMHGNISEWCQDQFIHYPDPSSITITFKVAGDHDHRVHRGGSFNSNGRGCRSAHRDLAERSSRSYGVGFRLVIG